MQFTGLLAVFTAMIVGSFNQSTPVSAVAYEPVAVVELFTSQGCSSCPPADQLLRALVDESEAQQDPVYALSFHVAYWNYLGWQDPFSQEAFTERQRRYAQTLGQQVYTPQMIVNGRSVFVGSRSATMTTEVRQALQNPATHAVALTARVAHGEVVVDFAVEGSTDGQQLQLAIVERGLSVKVKRGENGGRTLAHDNVVRQLTTYPLHEKASDQVKLPLPDGVDLTKTALIAYVQDAESLAISGASRVRLSAE